MTFPKRRAKMGYERGASSGRRASTHEVERGGLRFRLDSVAGTVTCPICRGWGSAGGPELPMFMAEHVERHTGSAAAPPAAVDRSVVIAALVEQLAQLGADELVVVGEMIGRLVAGRAQYGELRLATDQRDWDAEASDELRDFLIYRAIARSRRAGKARG